MLAAICEFLGGVLAGSRVAGTIKNGIISLSTFKNNAGVELLAFVCALTASATWLMIATRKGWPVSTTYSIVSALAGVGVALDGPGAVNWGWNNGKGIATIFAGFGIAPGISAGFGATVYLITKYAVLKRKNSLKAGLIMSPIYFFTVAAILTMSIGGSLRFTRTRKQLMEVQSQSTKVLLNLSLISSLRPLSPLPSYSLVLLLPASLQSSGCLTYIPRSSKKITVSLLPN